MKQNMVAWFEIPVNDMDRAKDFYESVFNIEIKKIIGSSNCILEIDLKSEQVKELQVTDNDRKLYLGGKGLGLKLLFERLAPGIDPLGEANYLAFMMGVLMGTGAPCSGRFAALTKSPLTGIMLASSCGGPTAPPQRTACSPNRSVSVSSFSKYLHTGSSIFPSGEV